MHVEKEHPVAKYHSTNITIMYKAYILTFLVIMGVNMETMVVVGTLIPNI